MTTRRIRVHLVRHGESHGNIDREIHRNVADHAIPLSERGLQQAKEAGRWLENCLNSECHRSDQEGE